MPDAVYTVLHALVDAVFKAGSLSDTASAGLHGLLNAAAAATGVPVAGDEPAPEVQVTVPASVTSGTGQIFTEGTGFGG